MRKLLVTALLVIAQSVALAVPGPQPLQLDSPTITGPYTSPVIYNSQWLGALFAVTVSNPVSGTLNLKVQTYDAYDVIYDVPGAAFPPITAAGTYTMIIYPGCAPNPGYTVNRLMDQQVFIDGTVSGGAPSFPCQISFFGFGP